jgi:hypothetical protein
MLAMKQGMLTEVFPEVERTEVDEEALSQIDSERGFVRA